VLALLVIEAEEMFEVDIRVDLQAATLGVDFVESDRAPEPLDKEVVQPTAATIHLHLQPAGGQRLGKLRRRELTDLVCIEVFEHTAFADGLCFPTSPQKRASGVFDSFHATTSRL